MTAESFNLTTKDGIKEAYDKFSLKKLAWLYIETRPEYIIGKLIYKWVTNATDAATTIQQQKDAAIELIRAGRENGVAELELELDQIVGLDVKASLKTGESVETKIGKSGLLKLRVSYK